jgi:hypothetical protein
MRERELNYHATWRKFDQHRSASGFNEAAQHYGAIPALLRRLNRRAAGFAPVDQHPAINNTPRHRNAALRQA